jgi:Animal haem peroxidase
VIDKTAKNHKVQAGSSSPGTGVASAREPQEQPPRAALPQFPIGRHGMIRGLESTPRSQSFEGRFGRMFRHLHPAEFDETTLTALGTAMTAELEEPPTPEDQVDSEENSGISAGYTYFGQFIDHDLTFDPVSSLDKQNDPDALVDFRTPRFDLDCVYGRGPDDQPYLYRADGRHFLLGDSFTGNPSDPNAKGVPRNPAAPGEAARALIGDPRNDENVIVSQFQAHMLRFHNRMADLLPDQSFAEVQQQVRWHYQWCVLNDFLPTIAGRELTNKILGIKKPGDAPNPNLDFYKPKKGAFIPVEFSVAAYRFGHSMIRPIYRLNETIPRLPIFSPTGPSLVGFDRFPSNWAIDWRLFFPNGAAPSSGPKRVQPAYKIDTSLVNPLGTLPPAVANNPASLPTRNLLRGWRMQLPSGQDVAHAMGVKPIDDDHLLVGKATEEDAPANKRLLHISPKFQKNAPLWFYVLAEAQRQFKKDDTPIRLGPVGGRIVGEVFVGLMLADGTSYLRSNPDFTPNAAVTDGRKFGILQMLLTAEKA